MDKSLYYQFILNEDNDHWWFKARRNIVISLIKDLFLKKNIRILEVWCWTWYIMEWLIKEWYCNIEWLDYSQDSKAICEKKWLNVVLWEFPDVDIKKKYDLIVCCDVLEHIDDDGWSMSKLISLLKRDWKVIMTVPAFKFLWSDHDKLNYHKRRYTKNTIKKLIIDHWWKILFLSYYNFFLFLIAFLFKLLNKNKKSIDDKSSLWFINKLFYNIFNSELFFLKKGIVFPWGVSLLWIISKNDDR